MSSKTNIKLNAILNVIKTISSILFPLITFPYASRILLPENIGKVNFASSYISYFTLIATLGITTYAIRECSIVRNDKKLLSQKASEIYSINLVTTIIAYILLVSSLFAFRFLDTYRTLIIIHSTVILCTTLGADWLNTAMEDFTYITIRTVLFQIISIMLMFVFVKTKEDYVRYAWIIIFSSSGANILNIFYRKKYCNVHFTINMKWKEHLKPILLLFVMLLAQTIFNSADITMLGVMKGDVEVGLYSTAVKMSNLIAQVVSSMAWVVMPRMSQYFIEEDYEKINGMLRKVLGILVLIGFPFVAGTISLAKEIVYIIGGAEYIGAAMPLKLLMCSFAFGLIGGSFLGNMVLLPSKKEKTYMIICCIATAFNIILNYFLIPIWGASAAAGTTAFAAVVILVLLLIKKDKRIKLDYFGKVVFSPIAGSALIYVYCECIKVMCDALLPKMFISVLGSVLIYGIMMMVMKNEMCSETIEFIRKKLFVRGRLK